MTVRSLIRATVCFGLLVLALDSWAEELTWIDVRTAEEFAQAHVPDAKNIPYDQIADAIAELRLAKDQEIYLYCGSGRRAGLARETLQELGYSHVVNVGSLQEALDMAAASKSVQPGASNDL